MLDVMYDLPSLTNVKKCVITKDTIEKREQPTLVYAERPKDQTA
jgi:ATP-dependent Clp protease ATP-binding subunit ClpX